MSRANNDAVTAALVDHVEKLLPSIADLTALDDAQGMGPLVELPAVYVQIILARLRYLELLQQHASLRGVIARRASATGVPLTLHQGGLS